MHAELTEVSIWAMRTMHCGIFASTQTWNTVNPEIEALSISGLVL